MPTAALTRLRNTLLGLKPSGLEGFEGLVAMALGHLTGQSFKVAKSGRQVGDAHSTHVAVECKLYQDSTIPQDNLIAKLTRAEAAGADLWVVATTAEIRHPDNEELEGIGDKHGIAVGFLDWPPLAPLPPLAILLATRSVEVSTFLKEHAGAVAAQVAGDLVAIAGVAAFADEREKLAKAFNPAHMGYAQARAACNGWLRDQLTVEGVSGNGLGQRANIASPNGHLVRRDHVMDKLNTWWANWTPDESRALLLGLEGMGKTWAALSWWAENANDLPLTVTIMARHYAGGSAGHAIADAIARQVGEIPEKAQESWLTKIDLWLKGEQEGGRPRILLILDGLNENPGTHWSRLLSDLCDSPYRRLVATVVTCRPQFWRDHVAPATKRSDAIPTIEVGEYTSQELKRALELNGLTGKTFSPPLMKHLRKPRLFRIAAAHLDIAEGDVTVARLIYRDWADRRGSKPGAIPLDEEQFEALVQSLAREAGDALRQGGDKVFRDPVVAIDHRDRALVLSEIVEGGLMIRCRSGYKFPPVHLEHGLGLVLKDDAVRTWEEKPDSLDGVIAGYMDPLRALPQEAAILRAAASLALFDVKCPDEVRIRLHQEWLSSQNLEPEDARTVEAHVPANPKLFVELLTWAWHRNGAQAPETAYLLRAFAKYSGQGAVDAAMIEQCDGLSRLVEPKIAEAVRHLGRSATSLNFTPAPEGDAGKARNLTVALASLVWQHSGVVRALLRVAVAETVGAAHLKTVVAWMGRRSRFERPEGRQTCMDAVSSLTAIEQSEAPMFAAARLLEGGLIQGDGGREGRELPGSLIPDNLADPDIQCPPVSEGELPSKGNLDEWWRNGVDLKLIRAQRANPVEFVRVLDGWFARHGLSAHEGGGELVFLCAQVLDRARNRIDQRWRELRPASGGSEGNERTAGNERSLEARLAAILLLWSEPRRQRELLLLREPAAIWHSTFRSVIGRLPADRSVETAHWLIGCEDARLASHLRYLATQRPELNEVIRRDVAAQLDPAKSTSVRTAALELVEEWDDVALGRRVADAGWRWVRGGEAGSARDAENLVGARCLGGFGGHLPLRELAERLPPRELAWAVARRGCLVDEVEAVAQLTDALIEKVRAGELIEDLDVPADPEVLQAMRLALPSRFARWVEAVRGPEGAALAEHASTLVYALCEMLLAEEPPIGLHIWSILDQFAPLRRNARRQVQTNGVDFLLATAPDLPDVRAQWTRRLDTAKTDAELLDIAIAACYGGKRHWLAEAVVAGLAEVGWRKARSFALAGFDDDRDGKWADIWEMAADGWVREARHRARAAHLRNYRAWRWFCRFLDHECNAESWVSHRLFFHTVDRRHQLWMKDEIATRGEHVDPFRLKCHKINRQALAKAVEDWEKEYSSRYLGHTVPFDSVWPWLG